MRRTRNWAVSVVALSAATVAPLAISAATGVDKGLAASNGLAKVTVHRIGTANLAPTGSSGGELRPPGDDDVAATVHAVANRSAHTHAKAARPTSTLSGIDPTQILGVSAGSTGWHGINHYDQRTADNGNQWSLVPPDQGLCASSTQVVENVNNAVRVYNTSGTALTGVEAMNPFFGFDHEVVRNSDGTVTASSHQLGDPSCVFDAGANRFFLTVYDATSDTDGNPTGPSFVDIAVSPAGNAVGTWTIYQLDTTDDGTDQTPSHPNCPCFADYPHIGTDANGFYITTNEYPSFGAGSDGANIYAMSKAALVSGTAAIPAQQWNTARMDVNGTMTLDGFTLAPALSTGTAYATNTMYFLSSDSWAGDNPFVSRQILVWALKNTGSLAPGSTPNAVLSHKAVAVHAYYPPPPSDQKVGSTPLADCLNLTSCAKAVLGTPDKYKETEFAFDSSDTRMLQSAYANGKLWGALDTAVDVAGSNGTTVTKAGVAYYVIDPSTTSLVKQGTLAVRDANITYPALGVTSAGKAVMALSLAGRDYFPSAAYVALNDAAGTTASVVHIVGTGLGPDDDFSGYRGFLYNRPRWGDYGAASVVGTKVWIASEYIAQTCTLAQYEAADFGTCGNTRTALANWSTHITSVTP